MLGTARGRACSSDRTRARERERGFTLVELMIVVVLIGILAAVVVPSFMRESRKAKGASEVSPMFTEISTKEEQYKSENGSYLAITTACPSTVSTSTYDFTATCKTTGSAWATLRVNAPEATMRCQYSVTTGLAGAAVSPPTGFTLPTTPATSWYYVLATCELDGVSGTSSQYLTSNLDTTIQKLNEGK